MTDPKAATPANIGSDVLHADHPSHLSAAEIAKAVARHKREHPAAARPTPAKGRAMQPQKTTPRG